MADSWTIHVKGDINTDKESRVWDRQSIYRVAGVIKEGNEKAYEPRFVSIGPYHHGKDHLKPMEVHKNRALHHFVLRSRVPFEKYMNSLKVVEQQLKQSYEQLDDEKWGDSNTFLQLMIIGGCFILEYMSINDPQNHVFSNDYAQNDPIFSYVGSIIYKSYVMRDMLLLENQLPYLVLEKLLWVAQTPVNSTTVIKI